MQVAIKCILIALRGCRAIHWAITDVRWSNIIFKGDVHGGKWWLIDCENVQKFGSAFPRIRTYAVNPGNVCNASSTDLALVAALLNKVDNLLPSSNDLIRLQSKLESSRQRRDMSAAELLELLWLKALDTPPSSSSGTLYMCCHLMFLAFTT